MVNRPTNHCRVSAGAAIVMKCLLLVSLIITPHQVVGQEKDDAKPSNSASWVSLFDGKTLGKWEVVKKFDFKNHGEVTVRDGQLILNEGQPATGIRYAGKFPATNYELTLDAQRVEGYDFFCGLTFPVGDSALTLVCGGWGGTVTGLSCIDNFYAVDNETAQSVDFKNGQWYRIRVRVTPKKVSAWIDDEQLIDFETEGRKLNVSWEMEPCQKLGVATWYTTGALRNIRYRVLEE